LLVGTLLTGPRLAFSIVVGVLALDALLSGGYVAGAIGGVYAVFLGMHPFGSADRRQSEFVSV
jgi:predicted anti-sigma-YlaC factor YlaD